MYIRVLYNFVLIVIVCTIVCHRRFIHQPGHLDGFSEVIRTPSGRDEDLLRRVLGKSGHGHWRFICCLHPLKYAILYHIKLHIFNI
jgi:hypothetical protein